MQISECSVRARCSFASLARVPARFEDDEEPEEEEGEDLMDTMEKDYQYIPELDQSRKSPGSCAHVSKGNVPFWAYLVQREFFCAFCDVYVNPTCNHTPGR